MTDLITQVISTLTYIWEEISNISPKYLPAIIANISPTLLFYLCISIAILLITVINYPQSQDQRSAGFEIAPDDEVRFESLVSEEEVDAQIAKNSSRYIPLSQNTKVFIIPNII